VRLVGVTACGSDLRRARLRRREQVLGALEASDPGCRLRAETHLRSEATPQVPLTPANFSGELGDCQVTAPSPDLVPGPRDLGRRFVRRAALSAEEPLNDRKAF
jgi:hypothetical protein